MTQDPRLCFPFEEVMLWVFIALKNPSTSAGSEPTNLQSNGEHITIRGRFCLKYEIPVHHYHNLNTMTNDSIWYYDLLKNARTMGNSCHMA
jgi:hypothetical protein